MVVTKEEDMMAEDTKEEVPVILGIAIILGMGVVAGSVALITMMVLGR